MRKRKAQRGIVIGPILFLIAIIGVLAAAIAAGTGGFSGSSSTARAKVLASAILDYAQTVQAGVDRVLANGCDETQISFENPFFSGYTNPNAPSDKSCHVFDLNGGGITWKTPPHEALDADAYKGIYSPIGYYFFVQTCVAGIGTGGYGTNGTTFPCCYVDGTTSSDLAVYVPWLTKSVCLEINNIVGYKNKNSTTPPAQGSFTNYWTYFHGFYSAEGAIPQWESYSGANNLGATQGCLEGGPTRDGYHYFRVLLAR